MVNNPPNPQMKSPDGGHRQGLEAVNEPTERNVTMGSLALTFNDVTLNPVERQDQQIWITSTDLAKALGYATGGSVNKIFERNQDEFTDAMTMNVKMTFNGINNSLREKSVRVFSLRGCHLIAMFANTPVAKSFRRWVLDVLDAEAQEIVTRTTKKQRTQLHEAIAFMMTKLQGISFPDVYAMLHQAFEVEHIDQIPLERMKEAVSMVQNWTMRYLAGGVDDSQMPEGLGTLLEVNELASVLSREMYRSFAEHKQQYLTTRWSICFGEGGKPIVRAIQPHEQIMNLFELDQATKGAMEMLQAYRAKTEIAWCVTAAQQKYTKEAESLAKVGRTLTP